MRKQKKTVTLLYGGISAALILVVATVALVAAPPAPPSMAEYAPSAIESIEDAPDNQQSQFGVGDGDCPPGLVCEIVDGSQRVTSNGPDARQVIDRARVRRCVGDPPRQTEDPQSPPCLNYWLGDNGGATSKGVGRDEIRVGWACGFYCPPEQRIAQVEAVMDHFNRRYELYGRKFRLFFTTVGTQLENEDPTVQRAAAERVAQEFDVFAALDPGETTTDASAYFDGLVVHKVIALSMGNAGLTDRDIQRRAPYQWTFVPTVDALGRATAALTCAHLKGRPGEYTSTGALAADRRFVVLREANNSGGRPLSTEALTRGLHACDADVFRETELSTSTDQTPVRQAAFADMRANGVTTVVCVCRRVALTIFMGDADSASFRPEWLMPGTPGSLKEGITNYQTAAPPDQRIHMFGLWSENRLAPMNEEAWQWGVSEGGPDAVDDAYMIQSRAYYQLLILASGVQWAGPNLTPDTFKAALQRIRFSNPGSGGPPYYQASVGFGSGDFTMIDDLALHWWDDTADSMGRGANPRGAFCFVNQGARHRLGAAPNPEPRFFDRTRPCR